METIYKRQLRVASLIKHGEEDKTFTNQIYKDDLDEILFLIIKKLWDV